MQSNNPPTECFRLADDETHRLAVRILCVEDNEGDFGLIREYLREARFHPPAMVTRAGLLADALQLLKQDGNKPHFDIVLLDLALPDALGVEAFHQIRATAPSIAITILSGTSDHDLAVDLVQQGAQDYLPKDSLTPDVLLRSVIYALKRQKYRVKMEKLTARLQRTTEELRQMQAQMMQVEKIDSLGRLASSIAHEVKNPLAAIQMGIDYLYGRCTDLGEDVTQTLGVMQEAVSRADTIIHDMLHFSRSDDLRMEPCNINQLVDATLRMVKHDADRKHIDMVVSLAVSSPVILGDYRKLEQVLINVIMNAIQAMTGRGSIEVRTFEGEAPELARDEGLREMNALKSGDPAVFIDVRDHGPGIPEDLQSRIFEPFFTTKSTGEGTGLGLPVSRRIIELHRGHMMVRNADDGDGAHVRLIFKAHDRASHASKHTTTRHLLSSA